MGIEELRTAGERLRWIRQAHDLTQTALGSKAGVSQRLISHFECDRYVPRPIHRTRIAEALGVHPSFIWHEADLAKRKRVAA